MTDCMRQVMAVLRQHKRRPTMLASPQQVVECPRCMRRGVVLREAAGGLMVEWYPRQESATMEARGWDYDDCVGEDDLTPEFGCGYDR